MQGRGVVEPAGRRESRKRATRDALIAAAAKLIGERGFDRVTTVEIAEQAGVSESTLFRYFPTKAALVVDEFIAVEPELLDAIRARPASEPPFVAIYEGYRDFFASYPDLLFVMAGPVGRGPIAVDDSPAWSQQLLRAMRDLLVERYSLAEGDRITADVWATASLSAVGSSLAEAARRRTARQPVQLAQLFRRAFIALDERVARARPVGSRPRAHKAV